MILELVKHDHLLLKTKLGEFDFSNPPTDPIRLVRDLADTMVAHNGLGLAANQVGLPYRVFVMTGPSIMPFFNPKVVDVAGEEILLEEPCMTYPGLFPKIKRPIGLRIRYAGPNGEVTTAPFNGMSARVIQHAIDNLNGVSHLDRISKLRKEQAFRQMKKTQKKFEV
jgi:peptide deformylase